MSKRKTNRNTTNRKKINCNKAKLNEMKRRMKTIAGYGKILAAIIAFVTAVLTVLVTIKNEFFDGSFKSISMSYDCCVPYDYMGLDGICYKDNNNDSILEVDDIFAIQACFENPKTQKIPITNIRTRITKMEPIIEENLTIYSGLKSNTLKIYVINNGWGDASEHSANLFFSPDDEDVVYPISAIGDEISCIQSFSPKSGEVIQIAEYKLNLAKYKAYCRGSYISLGYTLDGQHQYAETNGEQIDYGFMGFLDYDEETCQFFTDYYSNGEGDGEFSSTLFAVLDVDNFLESMPRVEDTYIIETVIAPTKSCYIECNNNFEISGKTYKTRTVKVRVTVPVYHYEDDLYTDSMDLHQMIWDLAEFDKPSFYQMSTISEKYRYRPQKLLS